METTGPRKVSSSESIDREKSAKKSSGKGAPRTPPASSAIDAFIENISKLPEVRIEKVLEVKQQIEKGEYETEEKIDIAIDRILKEIGG